MSYANTMTAGDMALLRERQVYAFARKVDAASKSENSPTPTGSSDAATATPAVVAAAASTSIDTTPGSIDWQCIAVHETGADWSMTGSSYSTALGIMNQAVRENASEEVAARVFAGTASPAEQIQIGESIVAKFGIDAWASSTVASCS